ncbi:hypothetical protein H8E88_12015 [candidate division KSB1 bacterium]|nr:hypothetical protein [candidate division KSB1 bacterium]MBL7095713.1 hypothetical protein [candidate division KSB1 bacterium]
MRHLQFFLILIGFLLLQNPPAKSFPASDKVENIKKEIKLLNLINGLELSQEQMEYIIQQAEQAKRLRLDFDKQKQERSAENYKTYAHLREELMQGREVSDQLKRHVHQRNKLVHDLKDLYEDRINSLAVKIKNNLQGYQLYLLDQFKPCIIPPDNTVRIGQIKDSKGIEKQLDRIRSAPDHVFVKRKDNVSEKILEAIKKHLPKGYIIEEEQEKKRILTIYENARQLSDIDYSLKKADIVKELISKYTLPKLPIDITIKIERHFLTPEIIQLLKEKLETN